MSWLWLDSKSPLLDPFVFYGDDEEKEKDEEEDDFWKPKRG